MDFDFTKQIIPFGIAVICLMAVFYGVYFTKKILQKRKGIKTNQIGSRKEKGLHATEVLMAIATLSVVVAELLSVGLGWNYAPPSARFTGVLIAGLGDIIFLIAVVQMKDSWRAGIPKEDKTELVTNGIYKFSRNPAFLGFDFNYIGICLAYSNPVSIAFTVFAVVMLHMQILQEEKFMLATFGDSYAEYKKEVFRYLGRKPRRK